MQRICTLLSTLSPLVLGLSLAFAADPPTRDLALALPVRPSAAVATKALAESKNLLRSLPGRDTEYLRAVVGERMPGQYTDHFVFLSNPHGSKLTEIAHLLEQTRRSFYDVFFDGKVEAAPINDRLIWVIFDDREDYERYAQRTDRMDMSWSKAYYSAQTNRVAIALEADGKADADKDAALITLGEGAMAITLTSNAQFCSQVTHEAGHQLAFNSGLQTRGVMYPLWVSEGLAANFEIDTQGTIGPTATNALRTRHLARAAENKQVVPIKQWVATSRIPLGRPQQINAIYGQAWAFFRFLHEQHKPQLKNYLALMAQQQPGRRSDQALYADFTDTFGDPSEMEAAWDQYVKKLIASTNSR